MAQLHLDSSRPVSWSYLPELEGIHNEARASLLAAELCCSLILSSANVKAVFDL